MHECKIIQNWVNEVGKPASITRDYKTKTITLYTQWPGYFIGYKGERVYKYEEQLKARDWKIKIVELQETFNVGDDWDKIMDERMKAFFDLEDPILDIDMTDDAYLSGEEFN